VFVVPAARCGSLDSWWLSDVVGCGCYVADERGYRVCVRVLGGVDRRFSVHRLVKAIKGRSSRVLREEFAWLRSRLASLWTNSDLVATVGGASLSVIKRYVETQKER